MEVGVRELRDNLSRYLVRARAGEEIVVTNRGQPIARIVPVGAERVLDRLIADGVVKPATNPITASRSPPQVGRHGVRASRQPTTLI